MNRILGALTVVALSFLAVWLCSVYKIEATPAVKGILYTAPLWIAATIGGLILRDRMGYLFVPLNGFIGFAAVYPSETMTIIQTVSKLIA